MYPTTTTGNSLPTAIGRMWLSISFQRMVRKSNETKYIATAGPRNQ